MPQKPKVAELDELYTFIGEKKRNLCSDDSESRHALCSELGYRTAQNDRSLTSLFRAMHFQAMPTLYYGASYEMRTDKQETYLVGAVNADLR